MAQESNLAIMSVLWNWMRGGMCGMCGEECGKIPHIQCGK